MSFKRVSTVDMRNEVELFLSNHFQDRVETGNEAGETGNETREMGSQTGNETREMGSQAGNETSKVRRPGLLGKPSISGMLQLGRV